MLSSHNPFNFVPDSFFSESFIKARMSVRFTEAFFDYSWFSEISTPIQASLSTLLYQLEFFSFRHFPSFERRKTTNFLNLEFRAGVIIWSIFRDDLRSHHSLSFSSLHTSIVTKVLIRSSICHHLYQLFKDF